MTTLTESLVELADRHTTLYHFAEPANTAPLPFRNAAEYCQLHKTLAVQKRTAYSAIRSGEQGVVLDKLATGYKNHKYWSRYLRSKNYGAYPNLAWQSMLPIQATLALRIECTLSSKLPFEIQPFPRVLLYPFGWSTWVSLRLTGPHRISELASFVQRVISDRAFTAGGATLTLTQLFNQIADGVRVDAFGKDNTMDSESSETFIVTTVMAKYGGSPALGALSFEEETQMLRLVRPAGPLSGRPFKEHVFKFPLERELEYVVFDDHGRFNWMEHLLIPKGRNHEHLHCYHTNSFFSLLQADHFIALLDAAGNQRSLSKGLYEVVQTARNCLESPSFKNASLRAFLARPDVKQSLQSAQNLKAQALKPRTLAPARDD